jgi:hypothetical protein
MGGETITNLKHMKSVRHLLALLAASFLFVGFVHAGDKHCDKAEKAKCCECPADKDGKHCGKDKPCCCEKKEEKK